MRIIAPVFIAVSLLAGSVALAQNNDIPSASPGVQYGEAIDPSNAIGFSALEGAMGTDTAYNAKLEGKVIEVCQKMGCFMKIERDSGDPIMVKFKDYGFFMPQDIVGKTVVLRGEAKLSETPVERLRHFAKDAGKSKEEIASITEPKKEIVVVADGVVVIK